MIGFNPFNKTLTPTETRPSQSNKAINCLAKLSNYLCYLCKPAPIAAATSLILFRFQKDNWGTVAAIAACAFFANNDKTQEERSNPKDNEMLNKLSATEILKQLQGKTDDITSLEPEEKQAFYYAAARVCEDRLKQIHDECATAINELEKCIENFPKESIESQSLNTLKESQKSLEDHLKTLKYLPNYCTDKFNPSLFSRQDISKDFNYLGNLMEDIPNIASSISATIEQVESLISSAV